MAKNTCENALGLNVNNLHRWGYIQKGLSKTGSITWAYGDDEPTASVLIEGCDGQKIELRYQSNGEQIVQKISIEWTKCRFGNERPWFTCPGCYRRCGKIYAAATCFSCRKCCGFCYESQLASPLSRCRPRLNVRVILCKDLRPTQRIDQPHLFDGIARHLKQCRVI